MCLANVNVFLSFRDRSFCMSNKFDFLILFETLSEDVFNETDLDLPPLGDITENVSPEIVSFSCRRTDACFSNTCLQPVCLARLIALSETLEK